MSSRSLILSGFVRGCLSHTLIIRSPPEVRVRLRTLNSETPAADSLVSKIFSPAKQAQVGSSTQFYNVGFLQLDIRVKSVFFHKTHYQCLPQFYFLVSWALCAYKDKDSCSRRNTRGEVKGPLWGARSAQKALQGSETGIKEFLGGTKETKAKQKLS